LDKRRPWAQAYTLAEHRGKWLVLFFYPRLEYDTERAGTFEPLRFVPKNKIVVLGLISAKVPQMEIADDVLRRIEEASKFLPIEQLALSPQCGFASVKEGNTVSVDDQRRKLELVVSVAEKVWTDLN
jgi:5-methyltetrahydropteroyltriglutamate--homocysteine methyltransferase